MKVTGYVSEVACGAVPWLPGYRVRPVLAREGRCVEYVASNMLHWGALDLLPGWVEVYWCPWTATALYARPWLWWLAPLLRLRDLAAKDWARHCSDIGLKREYERAPWPRCLSLGWHSTHYKEQT